MRTSLTIALALVAALAWPTAVVRAQSSVQRQAALILRILSYDRNIAQRASGRATVLVAYQPGSSESTAEQRRMVDALEVLGPRMPVARMQVRAVGLAYTSRSALMDAARREGAVAVYVCRGLEGSVAEISRAAREAHMLSMTASGDLVRRGLAVGLAQHGSEVQLLVNLRAVEAEGARLDAAVLRLAEVIR